jgi:hypothetical protein
MTECLALTGLAMAAKGFPPPGACDCHVRVIGPKSRFPLAREHSYTPRDAAAAELTAMLAWLGLSARCDHELSRAGLTHASRLGGNAVRI